MNEPPEFAEEATTAERLRFILIGFVVGASVVIPSERWLFPYLREFAETAECQTVFGINGLVVLCYGILTGVPLLFALGIAVILGRYGYRVIRSGRFPLAGEKVFRPTRIRRGRRATLIGWLHLLTPVPLFLLALWGYLTADSMLEQFQTARPKCTATLSTDIRTEPE